MQTAHEQLVVRQHDRFQCHLPVELRIAPEHAARVVLGRTAGDGAGVVRAWAVDCSSGGIGLEAEMLFPKQCRLTIRLMSGADGLWKEVAPFEAPVRVQRIAMLDRTPRYYLGTSFVASGPDHDAKVSKLLNDVLRAGGVPVKAASRA